MYPWPRWLPPAGRAKADSQPQLARQVTQLSLLIASERFETYLTPR